MEKNKNIRIVGLYSWHDGGYCVLEDGKIVEHVEIERYNRVKGSHGNSIDYFKDIYHMDTSPQSLMMQLF